MKHKGRILVKSILAVSIASSLYASGVYANEATADGIEVIEVTGMLSSLKEATRIKRDNLGMVDAIVAEDIGKFPDTNLAESLQRIAGVSIDRSGGEGNKVTVRGMGPAFNLVTLNGRQMPNAGSSRSFEFSNIAAEMVSGVEIYKTSSASTPSGGIGALINIKMAEPLAIGDKLAGSAKMLYDGEVESATPQVSGLFSKVINDDFGILVSGNYQNRETSTDFVQVREWAKVQGKLGDQTEKSRYFAPIQSIYGHTEADRTRINGSAVLQYAPTDNLIATVDYQFSQFENDKTENEAAIWFGVGAGTQKDWTAADDNGTITSASFANKGVDFFSGQSSSKTTNDSLGLKLDWDISVNTTAVFAYSSSASESNPDTSYNHNKADIQVIGLNPEFNVVGDYAIPTINGSEMLPENYRVHQHTKFSNNIKDEIDQFRFDYSFNDGGALSLKAGVMYTDQTKTKAFYSASPNDQKFRDSNGDPRTMVIEIYGDDVAALEEDYHLVNLSNPFISGGANYVQYDPSLSATWLEHRGLSADYLDMVREGNWYDINEKTSSVYLEATSDLELAGQPFAIVAGVRYEKTDIVSISEESTLTGFISQGDGEKMTKIETGAQSYSSDADYDILLPNISIKYNVLDDLVLRFAAARSITRPTLTAMKSSRTLGNLRNDSEKGSGSSGNPGLEPYIADNIDFGIEWYINDFDYLAVSYFNKKVDNFISSSVADEVLEGVFNPDTGEEVIYTITRPANLDVAKIDGVEISGQYAIGETGFGIMANATFVNTDAEYDPTNFDSTFALSGVSDSANFIAFYEQDGFQARIAYNWRDEFFSHFGQNRRSTSEPTIIEEYGQIDVSASYDITDTMTVFIEGINVTSEEIRARGRYANQMLNVATGSARYAVGIRASF
jgi:iron complex outermembrane receptor protein